MAGAVAATALPPLHLLPALLGFAWWLSLLYRAPTPMRAAALGLAFGYGWYLVGLYWVGIAFFADAERFGALAVPGVLLLALGNALFPAVAAWLLAWRRWRSPLAMACMAAVAWSALDYGRDIWGTRFPWNPVAIVWAPLDAFWQPAAWLGGRGVSLLTLLAALLPATVLLEQGRRRWVGPACSLAILVGMGLAGGLRLWLVPTPEDQPQGIRIVQGNIAQHHKWDPRLREQWFMRHLELTSQPSSRPIDIVVWPESAVPFQIEREPEVRRLIGRVVPPGGYLLTGGDRFDLAANPPIANNSMFILDDQGTIQARYDKVDLVPFGEYLPFRSIMNAVGLEKLTQGTIDYVPGPGRQSVALPAMPSFSPLICYEAAFGGQAVAVDAPRPAWLANITNDAWFGRSSGPYQHLAMARLRAVEEGLPLVRAANTGISVITDAFGRVRAELGLGEAGVLDGALPSPLPMPTFYREWHIPIEIFQLLIIFVIGAMGDPLARRPF